MTGSRGDDSSDCSTCKTLQSAMDEMIKKMDVITQRFTGFEDLLKRENEGLRELLKKADKKYHEANEKVVAITKQVNRLQQANLSRNLIIKGVPEIEKSNDDLLRMVAAICGKLNVKIHINFIDCYRIGKYNDKYVRPIVTSLYTVNLKNQLIKRKRSIPLSCNDFETNGEKWGSTEQLIYIDEHLTRENHLLYTHTRKLKNSGYKYIWTRNGRILARRDEKSKLIMIENIDQVHHLLKSNKAKKVDLEDESEVTSDADSQRQEETEADSNLENNGNSSEPTKKRKPTSPISMDFYQPRSTRQKAKKQ